MEDFMYQGFLPDEISSPAIKSDDLEDLISGDETRLTEFYTEIVSPWAESVLNWEKKNQEKEGKRENVEIQFAKSPEYSLPTSPMEKSTKHFIPKTQTKSKYPSGKKIPIKTYPKVKLEDIKKEDLADFRNGKLDLESSHSVIGHPEMFFEKSGTFKLDLRAAVFDRMPVCYQYEIMNLLPKNYVEITQEGRMQLKPGTFSKKDEKFKMHLRAFQSCLKTGEYDPNVRQAYIGMSADKIDPWKVENFEPVYGDLCTNARLEREISSSATSFSLASARSSPTDGESIVGRSEKENENESNDDQDERSVSESSPENHVI